MDETWFVEEIPFVCSLFQTVGAERVTVMYGWACADEHLWKEVEFPPFDLLARIERSIEDGIYRPASSDLFITASDQMQAHLCHHSDIHITTASPQVIRQCASRWLSDNKRLCAAMRFRLPMKVGERFGRSKRPRQAFSNSFQKGRFCWTLSDAANF